MARQACEAYGYKLSDEIEENFKYSTTHNDGVFSVYTDEMRAARKVGNSHRTSRRLRQRPYHRRLQKSSALRRGLFDRAKKADKLRYGKNDMSEEENIKCLEELHQQIQGA